MSPQLPSPVCSHHNAVGERQWRQWRRRRERPQASGNLALHACPLASCTTREPVPATRKLSAYARYSASSSSSLFPAALYTCLLPGRASVFVNSPARLALQGHENFPRLAAVVGEIATLSCSAKDVQRLMSAQRMFIVCKHMFVPVQKSTRQLLATKVLCS